MSAVSQLFDRFLGRGDWAVTVPTLDGPLLPNQGLEEAGTFASLAEADNLVRTDKGVLASSAAALVRFGADGHAEVLQEFPGEITALAHARGMTALAIDGKGVVIRGGLHDGREATGDEARPLSCITALTFLDSNSLLIANGSASVPATGWRRDLMQKNASGSLWRLDLKSGRLELIRDGLAWPAGIATTGSNRIYVTEAWRHRVLAIDLATKATMPVLEHLPAYPARIAPAFNAGYWLTFYSVRNQLVEFILREEAYRKRMLAEVPEAYWMAPSLSSWRDYREPMQGSQLKQMNVLKPYAVTRSYGLVVHCDQNMKPLSSLHSRADGTVHGTVSACEAGDDLLVASRGGSRVVRVAGAAGGKRG
ncbi:strictosidine synthase [Mesorhizobium sp. NZP2298]|uniref:strictosidine synthase n=1 Tax=Mesorhizobium sp. NZP2298 TaxID=2483403 RepID=UPI001557F84E|nr:strictosidine synthase [Mesorhizobium sp. NZP2298]QKC95694.1 strictosidine synthase [Mesorhizobium sp. NZP2298]